MSRFRSSLVVRNIFPTLCLLLLSCPGLGFAQAPAKGKPLAYLRSHIGQGPYDLWKTQPLQRRLIDLLGGTEYRALVNNMDPASNLAEERGVLHTEGNAPHRGGEEEGILLVDVDNDTIEVFLRHNTTVVRAWAENNRLVAIPSEAMTAMRQWPREGVVQALGGLQQAQRAANGGAAPAGPGVAGIPAAAEPVRAAIPEPVADPCAGVPRCSSGGPFTATISSVTASVVGNFKDQVLRIDVKFRNISDRPISLGYEATTSVAVDNYGNSYYWGRAGSHDGSAQGIGLVESTKADPSFTLRPGETGNATFTVVRFRPGNSPMGAAFSYTVAVDQLEILPSQQIRTVRKYSLSYQDLRASNGLINGFFRR